MNTLRRHDPIDPSRRALGGLRVAVYASGGSPYHHAALAALAGADVRPLSGEAIRAGALADADVLVVPGGGAAAMTGLLEPLGDEGADAIRAFVEAGGAYVGSCAGSFLPARVGASFWEENPIARRLCMVDARLVNSDDSEWAGLTSPGVGAYVARVDRPGHWLARGLPPRFHLVHYNGPMFDVAWTGEEPRLGRAVGVASFAERTEDFTPGERFMDDGAGEEGPVLFDRGVEAGARTALAADVGEGLVVLFGSHPEFGVDPVQLGWTDGARLFLNALAEQARRRGSAERPAEEGRRWWTRGVDGDEAAPDPFEGAGVAADLASAARHLEGVADAFASLAAEPFERVSRGGPLPGFMGRGAEDVWTDACTAASRAAGDAARQLRRWLDAGVGDDVSPEARAALATWLRHAAPTGQDYGFAGLVPLLARVEAMIAGAREAMAASAAPAPLAHAYDGLDRHPYQLAASSYLSAAGLTASATLVVATLGPILGVEPEELRGVLLA